MTLKSYCLALLILSFLSCNHLPGNPATGPGESGIPESIAGRVAGIYSGSFNRGIIILVINYISGKNVSGYNVDKGLRRNINGTVKAEGSQLHFMLKEPGDNPLDGVFNFSMDTAGAQINGEWEPLNSTKISSKKLVLYRKIKEERLNEFYLWRTYVAITPSGAADSAGLAVAAGDSTLIFRPDGTCDFSFYEKTGDPASQLVKVRGNYERSTDTFKVEWQKNIYTPAQTMKLIITRRKEKYKDGEEYEIDILEGHGWHLSPNIAG